MSCQDTQPKVHENLYQPLDESAYRVIHLLPGKFSDDIRCLLEIRSGLIMTSYEAVSYQWGDEAITRPISIASVQTKARLEAQGLLESISLISCRQTL